MQFDCTVFDYKSLNLTMCCPSMVVALTQMSWFRGTSLSAGGVRRWNLLPCGPGDFVWKCVCAAAACEAGPASGPYINHHMSFCLNKMDSLLCFPWTQNGNKLI